MSGCDDLIEALTAGMIARVLGEPGSLLDVEWGGLSQRERDEIIEDCHVFLGDALSRSRPALMELWQ